jgi:hypothetical protein
MKSFVFLATLLVAMPAFATATAPTVQTVRDCLAKNRPKTLRIQDLQFISQESAKARPRTLQGRLYAKEEKGLIRAMLALTAPADVNGAAYLLREGQQADEMYVFLPALNRVRRISPKAGGNGGQLFGTDFSYEDLNSLHTGFDNANSQGSTTTVQLSNNQYLLEQKLAPPSPYSRSQVWIDVPSCVPVRAVFYQANAANKVVKRFEGQPADIASSGSYRYLKAATLTDVVKGSSTRLLITGVRSDESLADRFFDSRNFYIGN